MMIPVVGSMLIYSSEGIIFHTASVIETTIAYGNLSSVYFREQTIESRRDNKGTHYPHTLKLFDVAF